MSVEPNDSSVERQPVARKPSVIVSQEQIQQLVDGLSKVVRAEIHQVIHTELPLAVGKHTQDLGAVRHSHSSDTEHDPFVRGILANRGRVVKRLHEFHNYDARSSTSKNSRGTRDRVSRDTQNTKDKDTVSLATASANSLKGHQLSLPGTVAESPPSSLQEAATAGKDDKRAAFKDEGTETKTRFFTDEVDGDELNGQRTTRKTRATGQRTTMRETMNPREIRVVALPQMRSTTDSDDDGMGFKERKTHIFNVHIKDTCQYLVNHRFFTILTVAVIAVNAVSIGVNTDWSAQNLDKDSHWSFDLLELVFCIAFSIELFLRIAAYQKSFFWAQKSNEDDSECYWNWFDAFLVLAQIIELSIAAAFTNNDKQIGVNISFMRVLRVLRVVRVIRLVRIVHLIGELRTIVASIVGSLKSLGFTIVIIVFLIYMMAVFLTQVVTDTLRDNDDDVAREELQEYFDSVLRSCLTLFQSMTNGVDWASVVEPLIDHVSPFMAVVFSIFIAFTNFAMLNVITGVFVESALTMDSAEKDTTMVARLYEFLSHAHADGILTWEDFEDSLDDAAIQLYFKAVDLDIAEARNLFLLLDAHGNGEVDIDDFITGCLRLKGDAKAIDLATLMYDTRRWQTAYTKTLAEFKATVLTMLGNGLDVQQFISPNARATSPMGIDKRASQADGLKKARFGSQIIASDDSVQAMSKTPSVQSLEESKFSELPTEEDARLNLLQVHESPGRPPVPPKSPGRPPSPQGESARLFEGSVQGSASLSEGRYPSEGKYPSMRNYPSVEYVESEKSEDVPFPHFVADHEEVV